MKGSFVSLVCLALLAARPILAAGPEPTLTQRVPHWSENFRLTYSGLLSGPTLRNLDGNENGRGTNLTLRNYLTANYYFDRQFALEAGWEVRRFWRPPRRGPPRPDWEPHDPYVGVLRKGLLRNGSFSLKTQANYFLPVSAHTRRNIGTTEDEGNGQLNLTLTPEWDFLGGELSLDVITDFYFSLARNPAPNRDDRYVRAKPELIYMLSRNWAARAVYSTGYLRHRRDGRWSKLNDPYTGQKVYLGPVWVPSRRFMLIPELSWGEGSLQLRRTGVNVFVNYFFL